MEEYFREQAELTAIEHWSQDYEHQDETVTCAVEDWSEDFEVEPNKQVSCAIEDWSEDFEEQDEHVACGIEEWSEDFEVGPNKQVSCAIEDWSEDFEETDKHLAGAIQDWSEDFEETDEPVEHSLQLVVSEGDEPPCATERSASSCSSVSTNHDSIFDSDEGNSDDDEITSIYTHDGRPTDNNNYKDAVEVPSILDIIDEEMYNLPYPCLIPVRANAPNNECSSASITPSTNIECPTILTASVTKIKCSHALFASPLSKLGLKKHLRKEKRRQKRLSNAEDQLASAWHNFERHGCALTRCVWQPIESQNSREVVKLIAATSPVPVIQITTPEGQVCDLLERASALPLDWDEYLNDREAAQGRMKAKLKKHRGKYEKYSEYCRRVESERWWEERQAETA